MDRGHFSRGPGRSGRRHRLRHDQPAGDGPARPSPHHPRRSAELYVAADAGCGLQHLETRSAGPHLHPRMRKLAAAAALALLAGCAYVPLNPPLTHPQDLSTGYRWANTTIPKRDSRTLVILTFSGGGTRAAGLSYGILRQLEATPMPGSERRTLLDTIDVISSVSGGSFASMDFGM